MGAPHKCPVCQGSGRNYPTPSPFPTLTCPPLNYYTSCNSCKGTGVVWEPDPLHPFVPKTFPDYSPISPNTSPGFPQYTPDPVHGLTFPKDFVYPPDIVEASKEQLIQKLEDWITVLKEPVKPSED